MQSSNPALKEKTFQIAAIGEERMTIDGVVNKTFILLGLLAFSAYYVWDKVVAAGDFAVASPFMWGGIIGGLIVAMITIFKPNLSNITAPIYALLEGLALGGISIMMEMSYPGIVMQAVALTFAVMFALLAVYRSGLIKVTDNFRMMVVGATGGIFVFYMLDIILGFFGINMPFINSGGIFGIGFSLVVVAIASMNLVLDFDFIENSAKRGAPRYMEWYGAFSLMVTLVWLYLEILRLISKARR